MITGIFKEEANRRFIATIEVNGKLEECYMASSSKLSKLYDLKDKEVLLEKNIGRNTRTKYVVQAIRDNNDYIWLNLKELNNLYYKQILENNLSIVCEKKINTNLRIDFFDKEQQQLIEVKGILSKNSRALFPSFKTGRFYRQLREIYNWNNQKTLVIILMNPHIKEIEFNKEYTDIYNQLIKCINDNLKIEIYKIIFDKGIKLKKIDYILDNNVLLLK